MNQSNLNGSHLTIRSDASPFETVDRSTYQQQQSPVPVQVQSPSIMPDYGSFLQLSDTLSQQNNMLAQTNTTLQHNNIALSAELSKIHNQNFSLQGRIAQLQQNRAETPRRFSQDCYGCYFSIEPNGKPIRIGHFDIVKFNAYILEDSDEEAYYEILYQTWGQDKPHSAFVPDSAVSKQSLTVYFADFVVSPSCSKKLANLFLYYAIRQKLKNIDSVYYIPVHAGFTITEDHKITFISNTNCFLPSKLTPPSIRVRNLLFTEREAAEIWKDVGSSFQNPVLCLLHAFRVAGILSTVLAENNLVMQQILVITSNSNNATMLAALYLKDALCSDMDQGSIAKMSRIFEEFDSYLIRAVAAMRMVSSMSFQRY